MADRFSTHAAVFIIIRNDRGEVLLQQRANTSFLDGYWDFPSGHIEPGESIRDAAARELKEEVGLGTAIEDLRLVHINQNLLDTPYMNFIFLADNWQGQPANTEPTKVSDVQFFPIERLPEKCSLGVRVVEAADFSTDLTYSLVNPQNFEQYMAEPFDPTTWGKS